ncbi:NHL domain protein [Senna tora]|uniref:NHL domain protein n=1 Tax=Senna tora TaxID=362788 RepID=A0A834TEA1_9FABA|nr:NHL domain protein [Senna tora]
MAAAATTAEASYLVDHDGANEDAAFVKRGGCCFWMPCLGSDSSPSASPYGSACWERMRSPESRGNWWRRRWRKLLEWSEIVAGPKWKTFIRRFNNRGRGGPYYAKQSSFQYDPSSYALNFDEGKGQEDEEEYFRNFSASSVSYLFVDESDKNASFLACINCAFTQWNGEQLDLFAIISYEVWHHKNEIRLNLNPPPLDHVSSATLMAEFWRLWLSLWPLRWLGIFGS